MAGTGAKQIAIMSIQSPFAQPTQDRVAEVVKQHGSAFTGGLIYEKDKTSYRSEVDQILRGKPDMIYLNGYTPDVSVLLRDLYRAGYDGGRFTQSYALTGKAVEALPSTRSACSRPAISARPPAVLMLVERSCAFTCEAVTP